MKILLFVSLLVVIIAWKAEWKMPKIGKLHAPQMPHVHVNGKTIVAAIIALVAFLSVMDWMPWGSIISLSEYRWFWAIIAGIVVFFLAKKLLGGGHGHGSHGSHGGGHGGGHGATFASFWELIFLGVLVLIIWQLFCQFEKDQVIQVYDLKPGESVETIHVNFKFMLKAQEGEKYDVKFTGCSDFMKYQTLENGATVNWPSCAKEGVILVKNPSVDSTITVRLIKVKGFM